MRLFASVCVFLTAALTCSHDGLAQIPAPGCDQFPELDLSGNAARCVDNCCGGHDDCYYENDCLGAGSGSAECDRCEELMSACTGFCSVGAVDCTKTICGCEESRCYDFRCGAGAAGYCASDCSIETFSPCTPEHPGEMMSGGTATMTDMNVTYYGGHRFVPNAPGTATALGGFYNGTRIVYLWDQASGALLASATNTSANEFAYTPIPAVALTDGSVYVVTAQPGSGGAARLSLTKPTVVGNTTVTCPGTYWFSASVPHPAYCFSSYYGMADLEIVY